MKQITLFLVCILFLGIPSANTNAKTDSGILFGPYVQRVKTDAATILIRSNEDATYTLNYRNTKKEDWKTRADAEPTTIHRFRLSLKKGKQYEYFLTENEVRITQTYMFATKRDVTNKTPLRVAVVGDYGKMTTDELRIATQIQFWKPEMILTTGDNAYESGTLDEFVQTVFKPYQPLFAEVPVYPTIGNHDMTTENAAPYKSVFELPTSNSGSEDYYSFTYDDIRFISMNSNLDYSVGSTQYNWVEDQLTSSTEQWKIVYMHHPPFSSGQHGSTTDMWETIVPLFEDTSVDLVLSGHDHDYERNSEINGVRYLVTGAGGKSLYEEENENPYSKLFVSEYHFLGMLISPSEIKIKAIDKRGYIFDTLTIKK